MVCYASPQTRQFVEQGRRRYVDDMSRKRASCIQRNECSIQRTSERKGGGSTSIHYNAEPTTAELLLRIVVSVNQLGVYGAIPDSCQDLAQQIAAHSPPSTRTPVANVDNDPASLKSHQWTYRISPNDQCGSLEPEETWCGNTKRNSKIFQKTFNERKPVMIRWFYMTCSLEDNSGCTSSCREVYASSKRRKIPTEKDILEVRPKLVPYWKSR